MDSTALQRDKTVRLFTYLKELSLLKAPLIRDIQNYEDYIFLNEIPDEPKCISPLNSVEKDTWVEIIKPTKPEFPQTPKIIKEWLSPSFQFNNPKIEPTLLEKIPNPDFDSSISENDEDTFEIPKYLYLKDYPDIQHAFNDYKTNKWNFWKGEYIRFETIQEIYTKFFSVYQKQKKLGEQYELLIGVGLLNWKTPDEQFIHRHILTTPCSIQFDSQEGSIRIIPSSGDKEPELEQDMLELEIRLDNKALSPIQEQMEQLQSNFWNMELLHSISRSFAFSLSANGTYYENELNNKKETTKEPCILFSPALILRKRNEKGFQQACTKIIGNLDDPSEVIPQGIKRIFEEIDDFNQNDGSIQNGQSTSKHNEDSTIYFPLEANEDQIKIITNLATRNGVLVQGPPGTGKSHTIANLISHLLSTGQRVLITSETARALKVLKDKIPSGLQDLCVSLLGADSKSFKDLEKVVQIISNKRDTWDQERTSREINHLTEDLKSLKEKKAMLQHQLRAVREKETFEHHFLNGAYKGTTQSIAKTLSNQREKYHWMNDTIPRDTTLPISKSEAFELIELIRELNANIQEQIQLSIPSPDVLLDDTDVSQKANRELAILEEIKRFEHIDYQEIEQISTLDSNQRKKLNSWLDDLAKTLHLLINHKEPWLLQAFEDLLQAKFRPWEEFHHQIHSSMKTMKDLASKHSLTEITGIGEVSLSQLFADVSMLRSHFENGKGLGMPLLRPKVVKEAWYIVKDVRINGRKCDSLESIVLLEDVVRIDDSLRKIEQIIQDQLKIEIEPLHSRSLRVAKVEDLIEPFSTLLTVKELMNKIQVEFNDIPLISEQTLHKQQVSLLSSQLEYIALKEELASIRMTFQQHIEHIHNSILTEEKHPIVDRLIDAITNREVKNYSDIKNTIIVLDEYNQKSKRCEELLQRVKQTLPKLYTELMKPFDYDYWNINFSHLEDAFNWAKVNTWFVDFSQTNESNLVIELSKVEEGLKNIITKLGAEKAWFSTLSTMTEGQRQHLLAWTTSMRKVGKGTGKNAHVHLRDAKRHMAECQDAIPAWIMPLYRVFETFDVKPNLFDVVIIDEASQSGPDAVILQYIAKKLIVVGDDKQISPEFVGIKREDVQYLRTQYVNDFKLADLLDIENSFFDLANVLFGGRITLREHYRCMPEIIEFSNRISYSNTPLVPLRQYPPNRLEPVKTVHVPTGYREGAGSKVINEPEAKAVVAQIKSCIEDPVYKDKSIGVISLQNEGQAQLIERLLVNEIGPEEMEKRNIICGDAYAFQGDERDIMFLSMVAAPGQTAMRALATEKDKRRFNVAVSRAKDQLWLFHTPTVNDFRNKDCLRYQLISYCENPAKEILESNRSLCESEFELSIFDQITARGYRVIPQHEVAGYRIDMVIEGSKGKIAVECDGDQWHGPDRYDYDMNRQRILERCGWKFWRVRGSDYYYNPEQALSSLWDTLNYYEIDPIGMDTSSSATSENKVNHLEQNLVFQNHHNETESDQELSILDASDQSVYDHLQSEIFSVGEQAASTQEDSPTELETGSIHAEAESSESNSTFLKHEAQNQVTIAAGLKQYLEHQGYEVIDMRSKGGALWLIGGQELSPIIEKLQKEQITFTHAYNGSKSTDKRPAWFTTFQKQ